MTVQKLRRAKKRTPHISIGEKLFHVSPPLPGQVAVAEEEVADELEVLVRAHWLAQVDAPASKPAERTIVARKTCHYPTKHFESLSSLQLY